MNDLGYGDASVDTRGDFFDPRGGEAAALELFGGYVWDEDRLRTYFDTRNGMVERRRDGGYSTKFAPWTLARGYCLFAACFRAASLMNVRNMNSI